MKRDPLETVYRQSSSITFITGRRGSGKTDLSLLLMEKGKEKGYWDKIASNTATRNDSRIEYVRYFDTLEDWLNTPGKKAFGLDELGKHLWRMSFMSKKTEMILQVCQLIRKYDAHLFGCAPSELFVNTAFLRSELLDVVMYKLSKKQVEVHIQEPHYVEPYTIDNLDRTSIRFITKDIASFDMVNPEKPKAKAEELSEEMRYLLAYAHAHTSRSAAKLLGVSHQKVATKLREITGRYEFTERNV